MHFFRGKLSGMNFFNTFSQNLFSLIKTFEFLVFIFIKLAFLHQKVKFFLFRTFFYEKTNGSTCFLKYSDIPRTLIFVVTFSKTETIVKIEHNLIGETWLFSNIHFWEVKKVLGPPSMVAGKILGRSRKEGWSLHLRNEISHARNNSAFEYNMVFFIFLSQYSPLYLDKKFPNRSINYSKISFKMVIGFAIAWHKEGSKVLY